MLRQLPPRKPFPFNYEKAHIDRNALYAINQVFPKETISAVRTQYARSVITLDELRASLYNYDVKPPPRRHTPSWYMVKESVREDLGLYKHKIIPLTTGAVAKHPELPGSKSPGLPYKLEGYNSKREALSDPNVLDRIRKIWYDVEANKPVELPDVSAFARAHIVPRGENKVRATWGYPLDVYTAEAAYFYPILEVLKNLENPVIAYGLEMTNGGMEFINTMAQSQPQYACLMGDWRHFDANVPAWVIREAFDILSEMIDFSQVRDAEGICWPVRPHRSKRRWRKIISYFIDTPIRLSNGERFMKALGVPSGSCFTNVIDSIVNMLVMRYCVYETTGYLPYGDVYLGDDSFLTLVKPINIPEFAQFAHDQFGMEFNTTKSYQTMLRDLIQFLGYYNHNGHPWKKLETIIASTIYPERTCRDKVDTISRLVGQAYSCFDPTWATKFVQAAHILIEEENIAIQDIDTFIQTNPHRFKYLLTLGIDPTKLGVPSLSRGVDTWRTQPGPARREWKSRYREIDALYIQGVTRIYEDFYTIETD